jgi:hypothetical protein
MIPNVLSFRNIGGATETEEDESCNKLRSLRIVSKTNIGDQDQKSIFDFQSETPSKNSCRSGGNSIFSGIESKEFNFLNNR